MSGPAAPKPAEVIARDYFDEPENTAEIASNWLGKLGIRNGQWFAGSKLKLKRGMKARCLGEAGRIWCCLGLHTECFQQELAVKMVAGKRVPLQITDIAAETGIRKQNVRRGLEQLAPWGLAAVEGEYHHNIRIYAWVIPRDIRAEEVKRVDPLAEVPEEWRPYFRRFKIQPAPGFAFARDYIEEVDRAAREYIKAVEVLKSVLGSSRARDPIQKNGKEPENNNNPELAHPAAGAQPDDDVVDDVVSPSWAEELIKRGVAPRKVQQLASTIPAEQPVADQIDYGLHLLDQDRRGRGKISNPAGFLLWVIEGNLSVPADFETAGKRQRRQQQEQAISDRRLESLQHNNEYEAWVEQQVSQRIEATFTPDHLAHCLREGLKTIRAQQPDWFARVPDATRREVAMSRLRGAIRESLALPTFEEWQEGRSL